MSTPNNIFTPTYTFYICISYFCLCTNAFIEICYIPIYSHLHDIQKPIYQNSMFDRQIFFSFIYYSYILNFFPTIFFFFFLFGIFFSLDRIMLSLKWTAIYALFVTRFRKPYSTRNICWMIVKRSLHFTYRWNNRVGKGWLLQLSSRRACSTGGQRSVCIQR